MKYSACRECEGNVASKYNHTFYSMVHPNGEGHWRWPSLHDDPVADAPARRRYYVASTAPLAQEAAESGAHLPVGQSARAT